MRFGPSVRTLTYFRYLLRWMDGWMYEYKELLLLCCCAVCCESTLWFVGVVHAMRQTNLVVNV